MKSEKHIIFSSEPDYDTAEKSVEEEVEEVKDILDKLADKSWLGSVLARACEKEIENQKLERAHSDVDFTWECESGNLDKETTGEIVIIADLGLWNGRQQAIKETRKYNLNTIIDYHGDVDDIEVYVEDGEVRGNGYHHDGTNHYIFREVVDYDKWKELSQKIMAGGKYTKAELNKATKSLAGYVNEIYGWK